MLPKFPVKVVFDPAENPGTAPLWAIPAGRILMLLWRPCHICSCDWFMLAKWVAKKIQAGNPKTAEHLFECFRFAGVLDGQYADFTTSDVRQFCLESLDYFAGSDSVDYTIERKTKGGQEVTASGTASIFGEF